MRADISSLPCAPRVVARVLDACAQDEGEFGDSAAWAALDPGLAAQLMDAAFSLPGLSPPTPLGLPQAFIGLGPARVQSIATHAAIGQLFTRNVAQIGYRRLWRDSVRTAHLSELIAQKAHFANPAEAYLAGLLCNIGQFFMLKDHAIDYGGLLDSSKSKAELILLEKSCFGTTHVEMGEQLVRRWNATSFLADAIRYQHFSLKSVFGAHPLVLICNLAVRLADGGGSLSALQLEHGMILFSFSASELAQMVRDAEATGEQAARELGFSDHGEHAERDAPDVELFRQMRDLMLITGRMDFALSGDSPLIRLAMQLRVAFGFSAPIFFLPDPDKASLLGHTLPGQSPLIEQLAVGLVEEHSLCARCYLRPSTIHTINSGHGHGRSVLDEQIASLAGGNAILCIPLVDRNRECVGVAAIGVQEADLPRISREARTLLAMAGQAGAAIASELPSKNLGRVSTAEAAGAMVGDSERWYRYLVENSPDIVYTLDPNGRFKYLSNRIETLLGYGNSELIGKDYAIIVHEEDRDRARFAFNERRCGARATTGMELRLRRAIAQPPAESSEPYITVDLTSTGIYAQVSQGNKGGFAGTYGVARDITERKKAEDVIRHQAFHDALTGLPNRALFNDRLNVAVALAKRSRQNLAVMFLDLDHFKLVNDRLGHQVGDQILQSAGRRLANCLRRGDTLARFGGDEFILLLPQISDRDSAADTARKILSVLGYPFVIDGQEHHFGASIGIALFPEHSDQVDELVKCADSAMYKVKQQGRNNFSFYDRSRSGELV